MERSSYSSTLTPYTMKNTLILTAATVLLAGCQLFTQPSDTTTQPVEQTNNTTPVVSEETTQEEVTFIRANPTNDEKEFFQAAVSEDETVENFMPSVPELDNSPQYFVTTEFLGDTSYTARIYEFNTFAQQAILLYEETGELAGFRILGIADENKLVVAREPIDFSPHPCFSYLTGDSSLQSLDLENLQALEPFQLPQSVIEEETEKMNTCATDFGI